MRFTYFHKKAPKKPKSALREWRDAIVFSVVVASLFRWGLAEAFVIPTPSMENSLLVGDYLWVSKIHYGSRTPRTPLQIPLTHQKIWGTEIPSYLPWIQLPSFRLPGLREVRRNEPVVFNVPKDLTDPTERPVDLKTYLVKRCVAIHGDRLEIVNDQLSVNGVRSEVREEMRFAYLVIAKDEINKRHLTKLGIDVDDYTYVGVTSQSETAYKMLLTARQVEDIRALPFVRLVTNTQALGETSHYPIFPQFPDHRWTTSNYGPLVIPEKGMNVIINDSTLAIYGEIIAKYEGHENVEINSGILLLDGKECSTYIFSQNYYFMMGDSRDDSLDSRFWGFVPEDHILGKPLFIWFSYDSHADLLHKVRWSRIFSAIK